MIMKDFLLMKSEISPIICKKWNKSTKAVENHLKQQLVWQKHLKSMWVLFVLQKAFLEY